MNDVNLTPLAITILMGVVFVMGLAVNTSLNSMVHVFERIASALERIAEKGGE